MGLCLLFRIELARGRPTRTVSQSRLLDAIADLCDLVPDTASHPSTIVASRLTQNEGQTKTSQDGYNATHLGLKATRCMNRKRVEGDIVSGCCPIYGPLLRICTPMTRLSRNIPKLPGIVIWIRTILVHYNFSPI